MTAGAVVRRVSPWSTTDGLRAAAVVAVGVGVTVVGWWRTADEASWDRQVTPVGIALVGFGLAAFGVVSWLVGARSTLAERRGALLSDDALAARLGRSLVEPDVDEGVDASARVVAHPTEGRFHRPTCALAASRGWSTSDRAELVGDGRLPCGICRP
jgi:hypothetical protein